MVIAYWVVLKQIQFDHEIQKFIFTPDYLRRMIAVHYMKHKDDNEKKLLYALEKVCLLMACLLCKVKKKDQDLLQLRNIFSTLSKKNPGEMLPVCF